MKRRVVITGVSAITPIGHGKNEIVRHLVEGISGVERLRTDDMLSDYIQCGVFGTVSYPLEYDFRRQDRKTMGPVSYYASIRPSNYAREEEARAAKEAAKAAKAETA